MPGSSETADAADSVTRPARSRWSTRLAAGALLLGCAAVLTIAAWLQPDPRGYGTHEQFGTGGCGWLLVTHYPCPTCGMTTAFAHLVRGHLVRALWAQPAGLVLGLLTLVAGGEAARTLVTGRAPLWPALYLSPYRIFFGLLVVLLAGWAAKLVIGLVAGTVPVP